MFFFPLQIVTLTSFRRSSLNRRCCLQVLSTGREKILKLAAGPGWARPPVTAIGSEAEVAQHSGPVETSGLSEGRL